MLLSRSVVMKPLFGCSSCRQALRSSFARNVPIVKRRTYTRPSFAPKPTLNLKHIRQNPGLYEQNCIDRNYAPYARNGWRILELHGKLVAQQREAVELRKRNKAIGKELKSGASGKETLVDEAKELKGRLAQYEKASRNAQEEMELLALELPNLSSLHTPVGSQAEVLGYINGDAPPTNHSGKSHVDIGRELDILDFEASATTSGWGWYFLKNEAALLEQALIQYALSVAMKRGWQVVTPPSLVYSHIASACGFMPRDSNGETQIYTIGQQDGKEDKAASLVLAGTAEIPFAGSQANKTLSASDLPMKVIGPSRCYRAEAGARGVDTKGLYRVHEFTKVEMFAWAAPPTSSTTSPDPSAGFGFDNEDGEEEASRSQAEFLFDEMLSLQTEILSSLGLHARILEMPSQDLGASATRKIDIEVFFPSRTAIDNGYGEVTSASICSDYQARRLNTKVKALEKGGNAGGFAHTVNGTALAVPRILAAVLENGWVEGEGGVGFVRVPEVLRRWLPERIDTIRPKARRGGK